MVMKLNKFKIMGVVAILLICGFYVTYRNITRAPVSVIDSESDFSYNAGQFYTEFTENNDAFQQKHLNKIIDITGVVTSVQDSLIILNNKILCITNIKDRTITKDDSIQIKGKYIGYDELFDNLKMSECIIEFY